MSIYEMLTLAILARLIYAELKPYVYIRFNRTFFQKKIKGVSFTWWYKFHHGGGKTGRVLLDWNWRNPTDKPRKR